jgi:hypothetical protein
VNTPLMKGEYGGHSGSRLLAVGDRWWFTTIGQVLGTAPMSDPGTLQFPGYRHSRPVGCTTFRATPNWIFGNLTGYPLDPSGPNAPIEHSAAARNSCDVGSFPANGLLYLGPNHCFCYPYVPGSTAFDSERFPGAQDADRLVRGSAAPAPAKTDSAAWPMQLATPDRRNWTADAIPAVLEPLWTAQPSGTRPAEALDRNWSAHFFAQGPVTGLSIGEGTAVGAISHRQEVVALDPATGGERWRAALDGRIDTQPTIHRGLVLAGTANGYVYALNRDTGSLVWRFRAAPLEQRIVVDGQLESPWPAHGAITVDGDLVYAMAGRHSDADGGLWLWVLDARSGAERSRQRIGQDELHPTVNVYPQWNPKDLPKVAGPVGSNLPVLTPGHLLIPGASFARAGDRLEPWTIPQAEPGEWGGWRARFEFGFLTPGNQGLMNRYHNLNGYMLSQYGGTSGRIFAVNGDDFVNLGATITTQHRGGGGGDQIVRLHRQKDWERLTKDGKPANAYRGSQPVWEGPARPRTGSTAMAVAGDAVLVAHATPPVLEVLALADGVSRQRIVLPAPAIANGISSDDGRVYLSLIDGTVMAFGKR